MPLLKKPNKGSASMVSGGSNPSLHQALKHLQLSTKSDIQSEKTGNLLSEILFLQSAPNFQIILMLYVAFTAQSGAMHMPMSVSNWPPVGKLLSNWLNRVLQIWLASTVGLWWVYPRKESRELERTDSHRHVIVSRIRNINLLYNLLPGEPNVANVAWGRNKNAPTEQSTPTSRLYLSHTRLVSD
ncbi:hypothetical protein Hdeb2414_s0001g00015591 [Helianthus debilis subsp. tardiflorus]